MSSEGRNQPLPLVFLIVGALVIVLIGVYMRRDRVQEVVPREERKVEVDPNEVSNLSISLSRQRDLSEKSRTLREGEEQPERQGDSEEGEAKEKPEPEVYPNTEDFATSKPLEVAMQRPPGSLAGWVSDEKMLPISGATVRMEYEEDAGEEEPPTPESISDENGMFVIEEIPPGRWSVIAEKEDFATGVLTGVGVPSGSRGDPVSLKLGPELVIEGSVVAAEEPVEGATIRISRRHISVQSSGAVNSLIIDYGEVKTDEEGSFTLNKLPRAKMGIGVRAEGYARLEREIEVVPKMPPVVLYLEPEAVLAGSVRGPRNESVGGAVLELREPDSAADSKVLATTKSGENGDFEFDQLPARQEYDLYATAEKYEAAGPIRVMSGTRTNIVNLKSGGVIEGRVIGLSDEQPVANIRIVAMSDEAGRQASLTSKTNSNGRYQITRLPSGTYNVAIYSETLTSEPRMGVEVKENQATEGVDFTIYPGQEISGQVEDGDTGERLGNASVNLESRIGPGLLMTKKTSDVTNESGQFRFPNLPLGVYTLRASLDGYTRGANDEGTTRVELLQDIAPQPVTLKLFRGAVISGTVVDLNGAGIGGALVQVFHARGSPGRIRTRDFTATTGTNGSFLLQGIPVHEEVHLRVSAWAEGYGKGKSEKLVLNRAQFERSTSVVIGEGAPLTVYVGSTEGVGLGDADVRLSHREFPGDPSPPAWSKKTGDGGEAVFEKIPHGSVRVSASRSGYLSAGTNVNVTGDEPAVAELELEPARILTGKVIDDRGESITAGSVKAIREQGATGGGSSGISSDGSFRIDSLGEGTFRLEITAERATGSGRRKMKWNISGIAPNDGGSDVILQVPFNGTMRGTVVIAASENSPPNFTVRLRGSYRDAADLSQNFGTGYTFTDTNTFVLPSIPPGEYRVEVSAPNYLPVSVGSFDVESPGETSAGVINLQPGGELRYSVVNSQSGEPIGGVLGRLDQEGPSTKTNGNGEARMSPVKPGIYTLELSHGEFLNKSENLVRITRGQETDLGELELDPGAELYGQVTDGSNDTLKGIRVEARAVESDQVKSTSTDGGGNYSIKGLKPGGHIVSFSGTVNERRVAKSMELTVSAAEAREENVTLWANSTLRGILVGPGFADLNRSIVTLYPLRPDLSPMVNESISVSDVSGNRFVERHLVDGYYLVAVQAPTSGGGTFYWAEAATVFDRETQVMVDAGTSSINGRILQSPNGPAVQDQGVRLELLSAPQSGVAGLRNWWQWTARTDEEGNFSFSHLPAGTFSLVANNESLESDILEIVTIDGPGTRLTRDYFFEE